ncbi:MAG TPA: DPP IV N-terminal domain-containing protein [Anditalea sp.]|nr:DPP IV N-terminal domain-containing protein [Anditalea sp.]
MMKYIIYTNSNFKRHISLTFLIIVYVGFCGIAKGQGSIEDYQRAEVLKEKMDNGMYYVPSNFTWLEGQDKFWYINPTPDGKEFILVDVQKRKREPAFNHQKIAQALSSVNGKVIDPYQLPFLSINFLNEKEFEFQFNDKKWKYNTGNNRLEELGKVEKRSENGYWGTNRETQNENHPIISPDGDWEAFIKNNNVYIRSTGDISEEFALSFDGSPGEYYSSDISWSPDSKHLSTHKIRPNKERLLYLIESAPSDQLQPKLHTRNYLKPGDALPQKQPQLFSVTNKEQIPVNAGLGNQYRVTNPVWRKDSRSFTFEYNERGHQVYKVLEVNAETGLVTDLIHETSDTFIDYSGKLYRYDIGDGSEIIWASERDGWNHLYLYDGNTGKVKNQITTGEWVVRNVVDVNEDDRTIIFSGSGRDQGEDPYLIKYYKIGFDGKGLTTLTAENANHKAYFSSDQKYFVDTYSRLDLAPVTVLRNAKDGAVIMELEKADVSEILDAGWQAPEVFSAKGRDGVTDIWGFIIRPSNFDPKKQYPIIEYIYAGPHSSHVPKTYNSEFRYRFLHELAELGFIVVQMDGMGTSNRSKAFHDVAWKNLKDAGFPDRILWIKAAAEKYPYMDTSRVGIFGNSAGGQSSAGALLFHPDFYKVAVSSSGCHDNRMDKMWWNEQWMGFPIGPHYAESSNVTHAHKLEGNLMLILGELDDNVDPASSLQLVDALIKADKDFEFLMIPGMGHSLGGDYGERKRREFFVKHLY